LCYPGETVVFRCIWTHDANCHGITLSQQTATHFLDIKSKKSKTESITSILSSHRKEDIARNKHIVKEIIEVLILYGRPFEKRIPKPMSLFKPHFLLTAQIYGI
jgi:hypothetical protein